MSTTSASTTITTPDASASQSALPIQNTLWNPPARARDVSGAENLGPTEPCFSPRASHPQLYDIEPGQNYTIDRGQLLPDSPFLYDGSYYADIWLSGIVFAFVDTDAPADQLAASYGDQTYPPSKWKRPDENATCVLFTYTFPLTASSPPSDATQGPTPNLTFPQLTSGTYSILITNASIEFSPVAPASPPSTSTAGSSSSKGPPIFTIVPAVLIPLLLILTAIALFVFWRRRRRARMAPSAAFRATQRKAPVRTTASPFLSPPPPPPKSQPRMREGPARMPSSSSAVRANDDDLPDYTPALKPSRYRSMDQKRPMLNLQT
ncbi:hypothetical protein BKA62DRAFT_829146 [Auriculariales sp. MPI-PUGE-AT-0066]|nr:hypothetical protein BKA62DRAFT_829146 [Auriculariales sp. MPI-PUGE-AT-0066]